jgi:hypothetical protein
VILQFQFSYNETLVHVLHLRGRTAFLATELGAAAGYGEGGRRFVDLIIHEWAPSLEEDDDVAQITGPELAALRREVPLPENATLALVLFRTGAERTLMRADAKFAKPLLGFLYKDVLSRVVTLRAEAPEPAPDAAAPSGDSAGPDGGGSPPPPPPRVPFWDLAACDHAATDLRRAEITGAVLRYRAINRLAYELSKDGFLTEGAANDLRVEAVEELIGRRLRTELPTFADPSDSPLAA